MKLEGSCHCRRVHFAVTSRHPYPFNVCYCSICRKTAGGSGHAINLGADFDTLEVQGGEHISVYRAKLEIGGETTMSLAERSFCKHCGSYLWVWDPRWPDLLHPFASAIDSELPGAPEHTHLMLASRASWVAVNVQEADLTFDEYPEESIAQWHERLRLTDDEPD